MFAPRALAHHFANAVWKLWAVDAIENHFRHRKLPFDRFPARFEINRFRQTSPLLAASWLCQTAQPAARISLLRALWTLFRARGSQHSDAAQGHCRHHSIFMAQGGF